MPQPLENLPKPNSNDVRLVVSPSRIYASIAYSGRWSEERFVAHRTKLEQWIDKREWIQNGNAVFARYNSPFTLWFLRRNEVLIPVVRIQTD